MFVDARVDYKSHRLLLLEPSGAVEEVPLVAPYFYVIVPGPQVRAVKALLEGEDVGVEEDSRTPVIYYNNRYRVSRGHRVLRVVTESPADVPKLATSLYERGFRVAASNVRYVIRNCFDRWVRFLDVIPIYWGLDSTLGKRISEVEGLVIDVEVVDGKPVLASTYVYRPFEEVRADGVKSYRLPAEAGDLLRELLKYGVIYGHNIIGFDMPVLERSGIQLPREGKLFFDTSVVLATYGSSLGVGSARSLLDVATIMAEEVGITEGELRVKREVGGRVESLSFEDMCRYNANDVVLTAKILNSIAPFIYTVSAVTAIPVSQVINMPSGMIAEYALLRDMELRGYVPEYRVNDVVLKGERVYLESAGSEFRNVIHVDVKAMYPNYVLHNYVDPTLHREGFSFDRSLGEGFIYAFTKRMYEVRMMTRELKKRDSRYGPIDKGVKAILNALAYGVQAKHSGFAPMGNPWCPAAIFYGTRDAQFSTIEYLRSRGYRVIYGDTDSFFIVKEGASPEEVLGTVNEFLARYGLEADLEEVWDYMFIYSKKNYVCRKGGKVLLKGSALKNLNRYYLPEAVSFIELLRTDDLRERARLLESMVDSARVEDLFVRTHQQAWRLVGKDLQSWKRLGSRRGRYLTVLTPWGEKPLIVLKKANTSHLIMPHSNPILTLFLKHAVGRGDGEYEVSIPLTELNPFEIVELSSLRLEGPLAGLRARYGSYDLLVLYGGTYLVSLKGLWYVLACGGERKVIPSYYTWSGGSRSRPLLEQIKARVAFRRVEVSAEELRRVVKAYCRSVLRQYRFL